MRRSTTTRTVPPAQRPFDTARRLIATALPWLAAAAFLAAPHAGLAAFSGDPLHPMGRSVNIEIIIGRVVNIILGLLGSLSLLMFVYGGIIWMTAQGNEEKIKKAKNTIVYSVLGLIIAFSAYEILRFMFNTVIRGAVTGSPS